MTEYMNHYLGSVNEILQLSVPLYLAGIPAAVSVYLLAGTAVVGLNKRLCGSKDIKTSTGDYIAGILLWPAVLLWLLCVATFLTSGAVLGETLVRLARRIGGESRDALTEEQAETKRQREAVEAATKREEELRQRKAAQAKRQQYDDEVDDSIPF